MADLEDGEVDVTLVEGDAWPPPSDEPALPPPAEADALDAWRAGFDGAVFPPGPPAAAAAANEGGGGGGLAARKAKKRKREAGALASACPAWLRGVCAAAPRGGKCDAGSHAAGPCAQWKGGCCTRGSQCFNVHAGSPGKPGAAAAAAEAAAPPRRAFTLKQAKSFRALLAAPDAAERMDELRALVGPLLPLTPGAPPGAADGPALPSGHAPNCGCDDCAAAAAVAAAEAEEAGGEPPARAEGAEGEEAVAERKAEARAVVAACSGVITHPAAVSIWRDVLGALKRF